MHCRTPQTVFFFFIFLFLLPGLKGTEAVHLDSSVLEVRSFRASRLEEYKKQKEFIYEPVQNHESFWQQVIWWVTNFLHRIGLSGRSATLAGYLMEGLLILLLIFFIILLVRQKYHSAFSSSPQLLGMEAVREEGLPPEEQLEVLLQNALKNANYRLAVRYLYLRLLYAFNAAGKISIQWDKTGRDYEKELKDAGLAADFRKLTIIYECIWYGGFASGADQFAAFRNQYTNLINRMA